MPKVVNTPKNLKPYLFHGVRLDWGDGTGNAVGECPFCGREGKFAVKVETGEWQCFVCRTGTDKGGGNHYTFIRQLWERSDAATNNYEELATHRKLLYPETPMHWAAAKSITTHDWLVPGYGIDGKMNQLYRYIKDQASGKFKLLPTPELHHHLHGINLFDNTKQDVYICEGPWDGMALWEVLRSAKNDEQGGLAQTGNEQNSLYANASVVVVPGCGSVGEPFKKWLPLFAGKRVILMFDSDHPKENAGKVVPSAGYEAMKRATALLAGAEEPPKQIYYLNWSKGSNVQGYDPKLPSGTDVRDWLGGQSTTSGRVERLRQLLDRVEPIPADWLQGRTLDAKKGGGMEMELLTCTSWKDLQNCCRKAMKWTDGLDRALSVMLATVLSTKLLGDQLWVKIIGPASCGKSTLAEALSCNKRFVFAKSTIRGFHSGFQTDKEGKEDNSLIVKLRDKTLVTKDGDTLLQSPNVGQILSEARDLYDTTSRSSYRNKQGRDYQGIRMTWLLLGTESLRQLDTSELGERFLDCVIMNAIDEELEDEVNWRVVNRVVDNRHIEVDGKLETMQDAAMTTMMQMTGGYVNYLRENASSLMEQVVMDDEQKLACMRLGKFVAYMRARPSTKQDETAGREMSTRLVIQHTRLALCLAAVMNRTTVDEEVMRRVRQVALDTARGKVTELVKHLYMEQARGGAPAKALALWLHESDEKVGALLKFLRKIGVVERYDVHPVSGIKVQPAWRLTDKLHKLYKEVVHP